MPEWAHVWFWLRFIREPRVPDALPQQDINDPSAMSQSEYGFLRLEWVAAGAPTVTATKLLAAMGARSTPASNPLLEPVPF